MASKHRYASRTARVLAALLPLVWASDAGSASLRAQNVIIVTLDTTRADVLAAYGTDKVETPALDRLSREGIVFEQATSPVPLTLPAHASLFTGLLPPHHSVRDNVDSPLGDAHTTLAEVLRKNGARTAAFVGSAVVDGRRGLAQGFDIYSDGQYASRNPRLRRPANIVVDEATTWIARESMSPFFVWVHLYDAHAPYSLPEPYRTMYEDAPYLGAIAFMDAQLQRLLTLLDERRLANDTLVIVAADHGEALGDHGEDGHGIFVYQSTVHIPLIVRAPRLSPRRVLDTVRLVDLMPTVLDVLRIGPRATDGVSLVPLMTGKIAHLDLDAYSESFYPSRFGWANLRALRAGRFKLVSAPRPELYDLEKDPTETRNIYGERIDLAVLMGAALDRIAKPAAGDSIEPPPSNSDVIQRIASLGYVSPTRPLRGETPNNRSPDDPKDCIDVYNAIVRAGSATPARPAAPVTLASAFARQPFDDHVSCSSRPSSWPAFSWPSASAPVPPEGHTLRGASR
jgi:arylsulfatase A-like enzyme